MFVPIAYNVQSAGPLQIQAFLSTQTANFSCSNGTVFESNFLHNCQKRALYHRLCNHPCSNRARGAIHGNDHERVIILAALQSLTQSQELLSAGQLFALQNTHGLWGIKVPTTFSWGLQPAQVGCMHFVHFLEYI